jgi:hypothetical protein
LRAPAEESRNKELATLAAQWRASAAKLEHGGCRHDHYTLPPA